MGSFSWTKADRLTNIANIGYDAPFKFLIPNDFINDLYSNIPNIFSFKRSKGKPKYFIKDHYQDYGYLGNIRNYSTIYSPSEYINSVDTRENRNSDAAFDVYELLALWNYDYLPKDTQNKLNWFGKEYGVSTPRMKLIDKFTDENRNIGIDMGCYDVDTLSLRYPLKFVSSSFKGIYDDCIGCSFCDPEQGAVNFTRDKFKENYPNISNSLDALWDSNTPWDDNIELRKKLAEYIRKPY